MKKITPSLILMVGLLGLGAAGCDKIAKAREVMEKVEDASDKGKKKSRSKPKKEKKRDVDYFSDATEIPKRLEKETKRTRALEILIYPDWARAQLQDPKRKKNADEYTLRNDEVGESVPVKWMGHKPSAEDVTKTSFAYADVDFGKLADIAKAAKDDCDEDDGKITHAILRRPIIGGGEAAWSIYISGERGNCHSQYSLEGKLIRTF